MKDKKSNIVTLVKDKALLKERPRTRLRRAFFSLAIVVMILTAIYFASPLSRLGFVSFDGLVSISRSELISLMDIDEDELFISINLSHIRADIENHPIVSRAVVFRSGINRLHVGIVEHIVAVCASVEGDMFHILSDGSLVPEDAGMRANCDELTIQGLTDEEVKPSVPSLFVRQLMEVNPEVKDLIQMIEYMPAYGDIHRFSLFMIDGNTIIVSSHTMPERLNLYPRLLLDIELGQMGTFHLDVGTTSVPFIPHGN